MVNTSFKVAEIEVSYKPHYKVADRPQISSSNDAYEIFIQQWSMSKIELVEEFKILLLNRRDRVLGVVHISSGGVSGTIADPKVIFATALKTGSSGIILAHNHPSSEVDPSNEDLNLTKKLSAGATLLDLKILDHLIISRDGSTALQIKGSYRLNGIINLH